MPLLPAIIPGVHDPHAASVLQPNWERAQVRLHIGLVVCPLVVVVVAATLVAITAAVGDFREWTLLAIAGSALPAAILLAVVRKKVTAPHTWLLMAILGGAGQVILGVIPAVAASLPAAPAVSTAGLVLEGALVVSGCVLSYRAMRTLLWPLRPELGRTAFTITLRARIQGPGLLAGTVLITRDGIEMRATSRRLAGGRSHAWFRLDAEQLAGARPDTLPAAAGNYPWLRLSSGAMVTARPGPIVVLAARGGEHILPVNEATACAELLQHRIGTWRGATGSR